MNEPFCTSTPALLILQVVDELSVVRFRLLAEGELTDGDVLIVTAIVVFAQMCSFCKLISRVQSAQGEWAHHLYFPPFSEDVLDTVHTWGGAVRFGGRRWRLLEVGRAFEHLEKRYWGLNWWLSRSVVGNGWECGRRRIPCRASAWCRQLPNG